MEPEQKRKEEGKHDQPLPRDAAEILVPFFERLTKPDLLERCMSLGTSNANESLHSVIWRRAPKTVFSSRKTVGIVVALGIVQFNIGAQMLIDATTAVVPQAGPSHQLSALAVKMDNERLRQADAAVNVESKSSRKRRALVPSILVWCTMDAVRINEQLITKGTNIMPTMNQRMLCEYEQFNMTIYLEYCLLIKEGTNISGHHAPNL